MASYPIMSPRSRYSGWFHTPASWMKSSGLIDWIQSPLPSQLQLDDPTSGRGRDQQWYMGDTGSLASCGFKMEVSWNMPTPSYHPFYSRMFHYKHYKPSSYWAIPIYGHSHMFQSFYIISQRWCLFERPDWRPLKTRLFRPKCYWKSIWHPL